MIFQDQADGGENGKQDCRCLCGQLMARRNEAGLELKCRRCKRTVLIPWPHSPENAFEVK